MIRDYTGKAVLITGGTKGIGLACALAFAKHGARAILTHRWGSADEGEILAAFEKIGAPAPLILEADASQPKETKAVMARIAEEHDAIEVFIANVCVVMRGDGVENHAKRALLKSLDYSAWPFVDYMQQIQKTFGRWPRYSVAMSSDGPDRHYPQYDYVAVSKAVLETFVRYMATHLRNANDGEGAIVNALRTRQVLTESYKAIFPEEEAKIAQMFDEFTITVDEVADTTLAMCSGLLDALSGQVITVDRGSTFVDNVMTQGSRIARSVRAEAEGQG
jgi:NAD(P)-dependent dehydrogenase (short-subunit alcohol dehydrogenase family)